MRAGDLLDQEPTNVRRERINRHYHTCSQWIRILNWWELHVDRQDRRSGCVHQVLFPSCRSRTWTTCDAAVLLSLGQHLNRRARPLRGEWTSTIMYRAAWRAQTVSGETVPRLLPASERRGNTGKSLSHVQTEHRIRCQLSSPSRRAPIG